MLYCLINQDVIQEGCKKDLGIDYKILIRN